MSLGVQPTFSSTCQRPFLLTVSKALVKSISTRYRYDVSLLLTTFLLDLACCEDHVSGASTRTEPALALRYDVLSKHV